MKKNIAALILTLCIAVSAPIAGCANAKQKAPENSNTDKPPESLVSPNLQESTDNIDNYVEQVNNQGVKYCDADFARIDYDAALREPCYYIADAPDAFITGLAGKIGASSDKTQKQIKDKYGESYFEKYFVVVLRIPYSSGSFKTALADVTIKDEKIIIRLKSAKPEFGTCDMATFAGLISLNRTNFKKEMPLEVYLDNELVQPMQNGKAE